MRDFQDNDMYADKELFSQYLDWTADAIKDMKSLYDSVGLSDATDKQVSDQLYGLAHNIKGMGASFNFSLMTQVGASLCDYLKRVESKAVLSKKVLNAHIRAFEVVLENRIIGDGGPKGTALLMRLEAIIDQEVSC
jgi:chemotaxis protein histidine kinase CheA